MDAADVVAAAETAVAVVAAVVWAAVVMKAETAVVCDAAVVWDTAEVAWDVAVVWDTAEVTCDEAVVACVIAAVVVGAEVAAGGSEIG